MQAAVVTPTGVEIREVPAPVPGRDQVLVRMRADLRGAIEAGTLRLPLDRSFPLAEAAAALAQMRANAHFGKIVLSV
jgi:NADPH:quinone reductase-like Zn-dependent oxidoreductase